MKPIIEVTHLGKKYTIRHQEGSYVTLRDTLSTVFRKSKKNQM
jgi:hypothetical protein